MEYLLGTMALFIGYLLHIISNLKIKKALEAPQKTSTKDLDMLGNKFLIYLYKKDGKTIKICSVCSPEINSEIFYEIWEDDNILKLIRTPEQMKEWVFSEINEPENMLTNNQIQELNFKHELKLREVENEIKKFQKFSDKMYRMENRFQIMQEFEEGLQFIAEILRK